jgi:DNA invertase Pin-like site-specific DNA recombinase
VTLRAVIYARVSSAAQRDAHTIEGQLQALPPYIESQGWTLVETYIDDGRTAKTGMLEKRDGFARLMRDAEAKRFDILVVVDVNRLTRTSSIEERAQIIGPFQRLGISIATPSGGVLDLRSFIGEFWVTIQALVAAEEQRKRIDAIKRGKQRVIREGKKPSGPTPYGYHYSKDTKAITIVEHEAVVIREIFERVARGETGSMIAKDFQARGVPRGRAAYWVASRIYHVVRHTAYRGEWTVDRARKLTIPTPPIVSAEMWHDVSSRPQASRRRGAAVHRQRRSYLVEGLATCALCGSPLGIASGFQRTRNCYTPDRYVCRGRRTPAPGVNRCTLPYVDATELDDRVWAAVASLALDPGRLERIARDYQDEGTSDEAVWLDDAKAAERKLGRIESTQSAIVARFSRGLISETVMDAQLELLLAERGVAQRQLDTAQRARFTAARNVARGVALADLTDEIRRRADATDVAKRRELVVAIMKPLGVHVSLAEVWLDVRIKRRAAPGVAPSFAVVGSSEHSDTITIRLVA